MSKAEQRALLAECFGSNVRRLRDERGLSREDLASRAGLSADAIYRIETARRLAKVSTWVRLAGGLDAEPDALIEGIEWVADVDEGRVRLHFGGGGS